MRFIPFIKLVDDSGSHPHDNQQPHATSRNPRNSAARVHPLTAISYAPGNDSASSSTLCLGTLSNCTQPTIGLHKPIFITQNPQLLRNQSGSLNRFFLAPRKPMPALIVFGNTFIAIITWVTKSLLGIDSAIGSKTKARCLVASLSLVRPKKSIHVINGSAGQPASKLIINI